MEDNFNCITCNVCFKYKSYVGEFVDRSVGIIDGPNVGSIVGDTDGGVGEPVVGCCVGKLVRDCVNFVAYNSISLKYIIFSNFFTKINQYIACICKD